MAPSECPAALLLESKICGDGEADVIGVPFAIADRESRHVKEEGSASPSEWRGPQQQSGGRGHWTDIDASKPSSNNQEETTQMKNLIFAIFAAFALSACDGPTGPAGAPGKDGQDGQQGDVGPAGPTGPTGPAVPTPVVVFSTMPALFPASMVSQAFQAQQTEEFGDLIQLAPGTGRNLATVTVAMVTWSTAAYSWPITLNLYSANDTDHPFASVTKTFSIPARPPDSTGCNGGWWTGTECRFGFAFPITFELVGVVVPDQLVYGIAYNTQTYGVRPTGLDGPYNSLNVGLIGDTSTVSSTQPSVGTDPNPDALLRDFATSGSYTGFVEETGWTGYAPAVKFEVSP